MRFTEHQASPHLRAQVAAIQVIESDGAPISVLPSSAVVLGFQFNGRIRAEEGLLSTAGVTGLQRGPRHYRYLGQTSSVLVRFTPLGATSLGAPADDLAGRAVSLDSLMSPALVRRTSARLAEARDDRARVQVIEQLLTQCPWEPDELVAHALDRLEFSPVSRVAKELRISERQLERRFRAAVGVSPREFASLRRFERAMKAAERKTSLTELALDAGYYDQSHFIREFRRFTGKAPGELLR